MTLTDIKNEVSCLGFDSNVSINPSFISSVKRALRTIYTERGETAIIDIHQQPYLPSLYRERIIHRGDRGDTIIKVSGTAFAFAVSGVGGFRIKSGNKVREYSFDTKLGEFSGELYGDSEISFFGRYMFVIYDLSIYEFSISSKIEDIKRYTGLTSYDLTKYARNFLFAAATPKNELGRDIAGASVHANTLSVPSDYCGRIRVKYRKSIPDINPDEPDSPIDLPEEYHSLLPLLTASYVWLDDDADKAQYYMSLYREGMSALKIYANTEITPSYVDVVGWA